MLIKCSTYSLVFSVNLVEKEKKICKRVQIFLKLLAFGQSKDLCNLVLPYPHHCLSITKSNFSFELGFDPLAFVNGLQDRKYIF